MTKILPKYPDCDIESEYMQNNNIVAAMDEVGRGSWAGPLVMAAVVPGEGIIEGVRDSKKILPKKRESLSKEIVNWARSYSIGIVDNLEIDKWGMSKSLKICAQRTLDNLLEKIPKIDVVLLDGNIDFINRNNVKTILITKGDNISHAIACASIIAKVHRDNFMSSPEIAGRYADFCFDKNKGYPAPVHKDALKRLGATPLHRISWDIFGEKRQDFNRQEENALF